ncbi:GNAT family N-acetyltransferase [Pseudoalteromonas peptidolytica]|uniref:N-acetyltransferase domain-containing protein n=1 Tax=Pseudoalteromonas peptidolytica F12-50-A1 TaxID=1315280 RepID=A0A8I0N137_9GAMM|nr:GNAT family N-acetyltransferase [Pseudoalteromonas peptidolytica]MBE0348896.1 hypothetical protein [Pseudoalteromonas peptidolytica F12-50-A1]NLR16358.1 GNAT family N-acetyltransferase [Pseudoalteromonas peptidolytica]GEK11341.1 N-acetyltransferase [Pseudoalteromonas peptidolytica]
MFQLREFNTNDVAPLVAILNDPEVTRYLSTKIPQPYTQQDALWWIEEGSKQGYIRAICDGQQLIGCIGVNPGEFEYQCSGELGYWLAKSHWGRGITHQAVLQIVTAVFNDTNIARVFASVFDENHASIKLLKKSGFEQEAILKRAIFKAGHFYDCHIFSVLKP